jgi:hypothetical protein
MAETLEELIIRIGADTAALRKGMKEAGTSIKGLEKTTQDSSKQMDTAVAQAARRMQSSIQQSVTSSARNLATLAAGFISVRAALTAFMNAINEAAELDRLSQSLGVPINKLEELRAVALLTGTDFNVLAQAVAQFGTRMTEQLANPISAGSLAVRALGLSLRDSQGNMQSLVDLLPALADRFSGLQDGANKTQLAIALFGEEAGPRLIPLLNRGREGLAELQRQVTGTFTEADRNRLREYQEIVGKLQLAFGLFFREIARTAGPTLISILNQLGEYVRRVNDARAANELDSQMTRAAAAAYDEASAELQKLVAQRDQLDDSYKRGLIPLTGYNRETERLNGLIATQQAKVNDLMGALSVLREGQSAIASPTDNRPAAPGINPGGAQEAMREAQANLALFQEQILGTRNAFTSMGEAWSSTARGIMGWTAQLNTSFMSHAQIMEQAQQYVRASYATTAEQRRALVQFELQLNRLEQQGMLDTANAAAGLITQLWPQEKAAAVASAIINTAVGVTKALTSGIPPWNLAQAALVAAAGAVQIATIRSQSLSGGGSISIPTTSVPSAPAPASAGGGAAGATAAAPAAAAAAPPGWTLTIKGLDPAAIFTGAAVDGIIERINDAVQNGATLISTRNLRF